jgi:hypothetical protein
VDEWFHYFAVILFLMVNYLLGTVVLMAKESAFLKIIIE